MEIVRPKWLFYHRTLLENEIPVNLTYFSQRLRDTHFEYNGRATFISQQNIVLS